MTRKCVSFDRYLEADISLTVSSKCSHKIFLLGHLSFGDIDKHGVGLKDLINIFFTMGGGGREEGGERRGEGGGQLAAWRGGVKKYAVQRTLFSSTREPCFYSRQFQTAFPPSSCAQWLHWSAGFDWLE